MFEVTLEKRVIEPHEEVTMNAGSFNVNNFTQNIILKLDYPDAIRNLVTWKEELVDSAGQKVKVFKIINNSNFLVYARVVKQME